MRVEIAHVTKRFGAVLANDDVSLEVEPGSIHGLIGENGAGKSTLMRVLAGFLHPDAGELRADGRPLAASTPAAALRAGVGLLHQEPLDFPALTVLESFLVGRPGPLFLRRRAAARALRAEAERLGFAVDPDEPLARLSVGQRQELELLRLLSLGARALLLDEPTTGISGPQRDALFGALRRLAAEGRSVILVSHKLADVIALCDRVTVMRRGRVVGGERLAGVSDAAGGEAEALTRRLVERMFGRALTLPRKPETRGDAVALELRGVAVSDHRITLRVPDLALRRGEVLGLAGIEGSGQRLLLEVAAGLRRPDAGRVLLGGAELSGRPYRDFLRAGAGYLPADRAREGLIPGLTLAEHVALRLGRGAWLRPREVERGARAAIEALHIHGAPDTRIEHLSGGNQQRAQLALLPPDLALVLLEHPTRGLDVESARRVWGELWARCARGTAIVFASSDLDEIRRVSDRVMVFSGGRASAPLEVAALDPDHLGRMIGGELDAPRAEPAERAP